MVILRSHNKITDFFMILAWASPFEMTDHRKWWYVIVRHVSVPPPPPAPPPLHDPLKPTFCCIFLCSFRWSILPLPEIEPEGRKMQNSRYPKTLFITRTSREINRDWSVVFGRTFARTWESCTSIAHHTSQRVSKSVHFQFYIYLYLF